MTEADRIFQRFPEFIREYIYRHGWNRLHDVQIDAARVLFESEDNLLLTSDRKRKCVVYRTVEKSDQRSVYAYGRIALCQWNPCDALAWRCFGVKEGAVASSSKRDSADYAGILGKHADAARARSAAYFRWASLCFAG